MKKRVTPSKSTASSELLFTDRVRGLVAAARYWPWVLSWHESVAGTSESPEFPGVGSVGAGALVASGWPCSGAWGARGPVGPQEDGAGLGRVVGDVAPTGRVELA